MALINHAKKEINAKIVYYGPAGSGKNTALTYIYSRIKPSLRGELKTVPAGADKLQFFDFSPFEGALPNGYTVRLHVYTLSGTVTNPATWKMTLKSTDGIMIMMNPGPDRLAENRENISQLRDLLSAYGVGLHDTPAVLQLNGFGSEILPNETAGIAAALDLATVTTCCCNAVRGDGVLEALTTLSRLSLDRINSKEQHDAQPSAPSIPPAPDATATVQVQAVASEETSATQLPGNPPLITVMSEEMCIEGTTVRIPLEIQSGASTSRLVLSVSLSSE